MKKQCPGWRRFLLSAYIVGVSSAATHAQDVPLFDVSRATLDVGPAAISVADFNEDSHLDLLVGRADSPHRLYFGTGSGIFERAPNVPFGPRSKTDVVGDWNHDGHVDAAFLSQNLDRLTIVTGDGLGNFAQTGQYDILPNILSSRFADLDAGDVDGDGNPDLLFLSGELAPVTQSIFLVLGEGDGSFGPVQEIATGVDTPWLCVPEDFNEDGALDLFISSEEQAVLLLGAGGGDFEVPIPLQDFWTLIAQSGDFNNDGHIDLVTSAGALLLGDGTGSFTILSDVLPIGSLRAVADLNEDSLLDVVHSDGSILLGTGTGFIESQPPFAGFFPVIIPGDFDEDGHCDLLLPSGDAILLLSGNGRGQSGLPVPVVPTSPNPECLIVEDVNGDQFLDVVTTHPSLLFPSVDVHLGDGEGGFAPPISNSSEPVRPFPELAASGDLDEDGKVDLAVLEGGVSILLGNGDGTFFYLDTFPAGTGTSCVAVDIADIDEDGHLDVLTLLGPAGTLMVSYGDGTGSLVQPTTLTLPQNPTSMAVADADGDNHLDVLVGYFTTGDRASLELFSFGGIRSVPPPVEVPIQLPAIYGITTGDLNEDDNVDLVVAGRTDWSVLIGDGLGGFVEDGPFVSSGVIAGSRIVDLNQDGSLDIFLGSSSGLITVFYGDSVGGLESQHGYYIPHAARCFEVGDFTQDGFPDIVFSGDLGEDVLGVLPNRLRDAECIQGSVNRDAGSVADVLFVNGSPGIGLTRRVYSKVGEPITVSLVSPPAGPSQSSYVLFVWQGDEVHPTALMAGGQDLGCLINSTPLTPSPGGTNPFLCLRGANIPASVCSGVQEFPAPANAPWSILKNGGVRHEIVASLQAIVRDLSAPQPRYRVSNALVLDVSTAGR